MSSNATPPRLFPSCTQSGWVISQSEGHIPELIKAIRLGNGGLCHILGVHASAHLQGQV